MSQRFRRSARHRGSVAKQTTSKTGASVMKQIGVFCISPQKGSIQDHAAKAASGPIRISTNSRTLSYFALNGRWFIGPRQVHEIVKCVAECARISQNVRQHVLKPVFYSLKN